MTTEEAVALAVKEFEQREGCSAQVTAVWEDSNRVALMILPMGVADDWCGPGVTFVDRATGNLSNAGSCTPPDLATAGMQQIAHVSSIVTSLNGLT